MLVQDRRQQFAVGAEMNLLPHADDGAANKPRFLQHQLQEVVIGQRAFVDTRFLEAWAAEIEHLRGRPSMEQVFDFRTTEGVLEKIALIHLQLFLREELPRFSAGTSRCPTVKIDFHGTSSSCYGLVKKH